MKSLIKYLFMRFCLRKHKFGRTDIIVRKDNSLSKAEVTQIFYDKNLVPVYQIKPYGIDKKLTFVSEGDYDFAGWTEYRGVAAGTVDLEHKMPDTEKMIQVLDANKVKVSEKVAKAIVAKHKKEVSKSKKK